MSELAHLCGRRCGKALQQLAQYANREHWSISRTRGGHLCFRKPGRPPVFSSSTPSDWRSSRNALAQLIRADKHAQPQRSRPGH
ncbi:hypothetical protein [Metapseudomonas furukawaii]|jgi:hypothetical protein|uniref:hypothetical protein n=1 Tax=Metapseudomonas furukawaii TaxID=1149133 RepID=UPI0005681470|nr:MULTISPECIES: hypothetical protein [Pseudomonas]OWJ92706.1 hypothetical protein B6S59_19260 [Pseudomonas sp. A46]